MERIKRNEKIATCIMFGVYVTTLSLLAPPGLVVAILASQVVIIKIEDIISRSMDAKKNSQSNLCN